MASIRSMLSAIPKTEEHEPVRVYVRSVADYAADIAMAQRRIDLANEALTQAQDELKRAQEAFIAHCNELDLSLEITPKLYPSKPYILED